MWKGVADLLTEMDACERAGATRGGLALAFMCMDMMAFLAMEEDKPDQTREDFLAWVREYLRADAAQPYQYLALEVYAARCAILHQCGSEAALHRRDPTLKQYGYTDGGQHMLNESEAPGLVLIGTLSFFADVRAAVGRFGEACLADAAMRSRAENRLNRVLMNTSIPR